MDRITAPIALALMLLSTATVHAQQPDPVARIAADAAAAPDLATLRRTLIEHGLEVSIGSGSEAEPRILRVALPSPVPARAAARALRASGACIVSTDVHQRSWWLYECRPMSADRSSLHAIRAGQWELRPEIDARPPGALPARQAGASPAYPATARARVVAIEIHAPS